MKKTVSFLVLFALLVANVSAQTKANVARECVLFELFTGIGCQFCPAAANGVAQLLEEGKSIAPVAYHTSAFSSPAYYTSETNARAVYYGIGAYPTLKADGVITREGGGGASESNYSTYLPVYNQRINQTSPFTITMTATTDESGHSVAHCQVEKVGNCSASNLRLMVALTQCNLDVTWQGMHGLHHVCRDMIPTQMGTPITGNSLTVDLPFELNWPKEDCYLTAWVQDYTTREVFQAVRLSMDMNLDHDVALKGAERYAVKNCSGMLAPAVRVKNVGNETVTSFEVVAYAAGRELARDTWTGSLPKGETAVFAMEEFSKGDEEDLELQVVNPNGQEDQFMGDNNLTLHFESVATVDGRVSMILKTDQHPEETTFEVQNMNTGEVVYEFHFELPKHTYREELYLMDAGCYRVKLRDSAGNGMSGVGYLMLLDADQHELFYLQSNAAFTDEYPFELYCDGAYGMEETPATDLTVYPNPSDGVFQLRLPEGRWTVEVFDVAGRRVYRQTERLSGEIRLEDCGAGVYFLKASNGSGEQVRKLMVF